MKKKITLLFLSFLFLLSLASCTNSKPNDNENNDDITDGDNSGGNENPGTGNENPGTGNESPSTGNEDTNVNDSVANGSNSGALDAGNGEVISTGDIVITSCSGLNEAAYIEFNKIEDSDGYDVYIKGGKYTSYTKLDQKICYIQNLTADKMRADLIGLSKGTYEIKIECKNTKYIASTCQLNVVAYDRSGYAHFKYSDGVGAYYDDGTLKDNAIVIYVTEQNKNSVMTTIKEVESAMFTIPGLNKKADGIGWWLNNAQYSKQGSNTYDENGSSLGFDSLNDTHPIAIRFVGKVTAPEGLTVYNSTNQGGTKGDNGNMARIKNLKNVTIEGVGFDAEIEGWGIHFINADTTGNRGKSFEVRNLTFDQYTEDALGMEGVQESNKLTASVERCWIHHITFLPGYCKNPAESDKAEGDGSCDFKRGQYYTMSYCYYENCHKTNLIGSSDSSLQYNISFHHNIWYNCGSRIPLLRQANLHFYNNYVYCDINNQEYVNADGETVKVGLSYITSLRANCYMYAENNYYEGCKQVLDETSGAKMFNNTYISCFKSEGAKALTVSSREDKVSSNCGYNGINYANFDTNSLLFYYDSNNKVSDCYLTSSKIAKDECLKYSGSYFRTLLNNTYMPPQTKSNHYDVEDSVDLSSGIFEATFTTDKGILYTAVKNGKFKGQGITFRLTNYATVNVVMSCGASDAMYSGYLVSSDGELMLTGSGEAILKPGVYYIVSCMFDKETTVSSLKFSKYDSDAFNEERIREYNESLSNIPSEIVYTEACYEKIKAAIQSYKNLGSELQLEVDYKKVEDAYNSFIALGKAHVEELINLIGIVDVNSGEAITNAKLAYNYLMSIDSSVQISNYATLLTAEDAFENFAVQSCIDKINLIGTVSLDSKELIDSAKNEYSALSDEQKLQITNYNVLLEAISKYDSLTRIDDCQKNIETVDLEDLISMKSVLDKFNSLSLEEKTLVINADKISLIEIDYLIMLIDSIGVVTDKSGNVITEASALYDGMDLEVKAQITNYDILAAAKQEYEAILAQSQSFNFTDTTLNSEGFTYNGSTSTSKGDVEYNGVTYTTCLKMSTKTSVSFNSNGCTSLTLVFNSSNSGYSVYINDVSYTIPEDGILTFTMEKNTNYIIKKNKSESFLYLIVIS